MTIALSQLDGAVKHGLLALSVGAGLAMVKEIMEAEVSELVGPRGKHDSDRWPIDMATRSGSARSLPSSQYM